MEMQEIHPTLEVNQYKAFIRAITLSDEQIIDLAKPGPKPGVKKGEEGWQADLNFPDTEVRKTYQRLLGLMGDYNPYALATEPRGRIGIALKILYPDTSPTTREIIAHTVVQHLKRVGFDDPRSHRVAILPLAKKLGPLVKVLEPESKMALEAKALADTQAAVQKANIDLEAKKIEFEAQLEELTRGLKEERKKNAELQKNNQRLEEKLGTTSVKLQKTSEQLQKVKGSHAQVQEELKKTRQQLEDFQRQEPDRMKRQRLISEHLTATSKGYEKAAERLASDRDKELIKEEEKPEVEVPAEEVEAEEEAPVQEVVIKELSEEQIEQALGKLEETDFYELYSGVSNFVGRISRSELNAIFKKRTAATRDILQEKETREKLIQELTTEGGMTETDLTPIKSDTESLTLLCEVPYLREVWQEAEGKTLFNKLARLRREVASRLKNKINRREIYTLPLDEVVKYTFNYLVDFEKDENFGNKTQTDLKKEKRSLSEKSPRDATQLLEKSLGTLTPDRFEEEWMFDPNLLVDDLYVELEGRKGFLKVTRVLGKGAKSLVCEAKASDGSGEPVAVKIAFPRKTGDHQPTYGSLMAACEEASVLSKMALYDKGHHLPKILHLTKEVKNGLRHENWNLEKRRFENYFLLAQEYIDTETYPGVNKLASQYEGQMMPELLALEIARQYTEMLTDLKKAGVSTVDRKLVDLRWKMGEVDLKNPSAVTLEKYRNTGPDKRGHLMVWDWNVVEEATGEAILNAIFSMGRHWHRLLLGEEPYFTPEAWILEEPLEKKESFRKLSRPAQEFLRGFFDPENRYKKLDEVSAAIEKVSSYWQETPQALWETIKNLQKKIELLTEPEKEDLLNALSVLKCQIDDWGVEKPKGFEEALRLLSTD